MRLKINGTEDPSIYRCCLCCHVRTGTIFLGIFHLFVHILLLSVFAVLVLHPQLIDENREWLKQSNLEELFSAESTSSNASYDDPWLHHQRWSSEDKFVGLLIVVGSFIITIMLIYGAVKGRAGYLMPFFCFQVFDFCISCLTVISLFSYIPDMRRWLADQKLPYGKEYLMGMDSSWLNLLIILSLVLVLTMKAYFIGMVWSCYKYLTIYSNSNRRGRVLNYNGEAMSPEDSEMLLPPKYEDVVTMPPPEPSTEDEREELPPPPPYSR